jgi:large subunit ribosomal protein L25
MRKDITIEAQQRTLRGKNEARRLRAKGSLPAIVYGSGADAVAIAVSPKEVTRILNSKTGHNTIFNLHVKDGENTPVMIVDWLNDPIKDTLLHMDMKRIDLTKSIIVKVPIHTVGEPKGVKLQGGLHELITRELEVECLPDDIPEQFNVDVTELMLGMTIRAGDIAIGDRIKLVSPADAVVSHIVTIKAEAEPVAVATEGAPVAAGAEPEVIKKGKKDEEAAEEKPKGKK